MSDVMSPAFDWITLLCCPERCGSNLIRNIVDTHPDVLAPNATSLGHLCSQLHFDNNRGPNEWQRALREAARRINTSRFDTGLELEPSTVDVPEHDYGNLFLHPFKVHMNRTGATKLVVKEHRAWLLIPFFFRVFPGCKVAFQVRDPRDYLSSCKKLGKLYYCYHGSAPRAIRQWKEDTNAAIMYTNTLPRQRVHFQTFEELVRDPDQTVKALFDFIGLQPPDDWELFYRSHALRRHEPQYLPIMWENLDRPIQSHVVGKWSTSLTWMETKYVESEACGVGDYIDKCAKHPAQKIAISFFRYVQRARFLSVSILLLVRWLARRRPLPKASLIFGNTIRSNHPYEIHRERGGYRL